MDLKKFEQAILAAATDLVGREEELCKLDSYVGDGDHGMTVKKGYANVIKMINSESAENFHDFLFNVGLAISDTAGGAIGPILASFFFGMSDGVDCEKQEVSVKDFADMIKSGMDRIIKIGGAQPGDRTLLDTLFPAYNTLIEAAGEDEKSALEKMVQSAYEGAQSTKNMVAKKGRAQNLGEKSLGYIDAGSMSMYYFLKAFADSIIG